MEEIKLIIEQYKNRLQTLKNTKGLDAIADTRLRTKASCYRTFISELERAIDNTNKSSEPLQLPVVSKSLLPCGYVGCQNPNEKAYRGCDICKHKNNDC